MWKIVLLARIFSIFCAESAGESTTTTTSTTTTDEPCSMDQILRILETTNCTTVEEATEMCQCQASKYVTENFTICDYDGILSEEETTLAPTTGAPGAPQIIDIENRITYSTARALSSTSTSTSTKTITSSSTSYSSTVTTTSTGPTTSDVSSPSSSSSTAKPAPVIVDVSQVIQYTTTTAPWTEYVKAADSISSTATTATSSSSPTPSSSSSSSTTTTTTTPSSTSSSITTSTTTASSTTFTTTTTTQDPACSIQCPDGYIAGTSLCYLIVDPADIVSYQYALAFCQTEDVRNLVSLEQLRNPNDLQVLKTQITELGYSNLYFANGGGSKLERFNKMAQVFDITQLTAMTTPISKKVGISDTTSGISAICVLPQYCNTSQCLIETSLSVLELSVLSSDQDTVQSKSTASITCSYTDVVTTVTCGVRGNLMPNPTQISCQAESLTQLLPNTTSELVASCDDCFSRGTARCDEVTEDGLTGYKCVCLDGYTMNTCWSTPDSCTSSSCSGHGKCTDSVGELKCDCDWGYEGTTCEVDKDRVSNTTDPFWKRLKNSVFNYPAISAIQTGTWTIATLIAKSVGKVYLSNGEDDPQETHQTLRAIFLTLGTTCVLFFNDPYLFKISQATCRGFFILIHFSYLGTMIQWMLEGYNANQVVRCVHLNEWERDFKGKRAWGIMAMPRMVAPLILLAVALALIFQTNWYQLPSTWTCLGVICNDTTSVYLSIFWLVIVFVVSTAAFAESSVLLTNRRPLYNLKLRQRIERVEGWSDGWMAEKCRRNTVLCAVGVALLSATWLSAVLAADRRDNHALGWAAVMTSTVYGIFSFVQGMYTDPTTWSWLLWTAMEKLPTRFAPSFDPISLWTLEEVKSIQHHPQQTRKFLKSQMFPRNQRLFLHHKWDLELTQKLTTSNDLNNALLDILRLETQRLRESSGTPFQKQQLQETFAEFVKNVVERPPRGDLLDVSAKSEAVTLCAEKEDGSAKVAKFMLLPGIDVFEAEEELDYFDSAQKRADTEFNKETYKIAREEAAAQNNFMNSAVKFRYYGKIK